MEWVWQRPVALCLLRLLPKSDRHLRKKIAQFVDEHEASKINESVMPWEQLLKMRRTMTEMQILQWDHEHCFAPKRHNERRLAFQRYAERCQCWNLVKIY